MNGEDRTTYTLVIVAIALVTFLYIVGEMGKAPVTEKESKEIARRAILLSSTYQFDGYDLKYRETIYPDVVGCGKCYTFVFGFKSKHGGYGNRTGEMVTQAITPHKAYVRVENGEVVSANLDGKWNILKQETIGEKEGGQTDGFCGSSTYGSCETDTDCVTGGCSGQVCQSKGEEGMVTTCEWRECYDASKYGLDCQCVQGQCQWK